MKRITSVTINQFDITAKFDDGSEGELLRYYPDEISFSEAELIGLTVEEARRLHYKKDLAYLRS